VSEIKVQRDYAHPPERVWRALTEPEAMSAWLMASDFRPQVGHKFRFRAKPQPGWRGIVDCEVLEVDPPRRLSYTWQGDENGRTTIVTWVLEALPGGGTRLRLEHTGFRGLGGLFHKLLLGSGWKGMLRSRLGTVLDRLADGGPLPASACGSEQPGP
jgi:uncharacterized protein YndB with AHSA1/START domain